MARNVTRYDMLISCPSDVKEELDVVRTVVDDFNKRHEDLAIVLKDWHLAYPETKKPQEALNHQVVDGCDFAVAIFWTRFGTPTDAYGSGTEEEISRMRNQGKGVFLYFSNVPVPPADLQSDQLQKVKEFKQRRQGDTLYKTFDSAEDFRGKFSNDLEQYIRDNTDALGKTVSTASTLPRLTVCGVLNGKLTDELHVEYDYFDRRLREAKDSLTSQIAQISAMRLVPQRENKTGPEAGNVIGGVAAISALQSQIQAIGGSFIRGKKVVVVDEARKLIRRFCDVQNIQLDDTSFFDVGDLWEDVRGGITASSPIEKEKYNAIIHLVSSIGSFVAEKTFINSLPTQSVCFGAISNKGTSYDEDIEIRLELPGGCVCGIGEFTAPDGAYVQLFNDQNMEREFFMPQGMLDVDAYSDYPPTLGSGLFIPAWSPEESRRQQQGAFRERMMRILCYEPYSNPENGTDIWMFRVSKLNQHKTVSFPSILYFKKVPDSVAFEIRSKHAADVIKGKISVVK
ncbi:MAG TPA: hypothetical protein VF370_00370 [Candidatus Cryosericum sp.]